MRKLGKPQQALSKVGFLFRSTDTYRGIVSHFKLVLGELALDPSASQVFIRQGLVLHHRLGELVLRKETICPCQDLEGIGHNAQRFQLFL